VNVKTLCEERLGEKRRAAELVKITYKLRDTKQEESRRSLTRSVIMYIINFTYDPRSFGGADAQTETGKRANSSPQPCRAP